MFYCINRRFLFVICSMEMAQPDSDEIRPTDPDMKWTGWALDRLREAVEFDIRTMRMNTQQQSQRLPGPEAPDYALMQSRLSRSVRLSIAMTERIRADYLMRKAGREKSGEQERRRERREQAVEAVAKAVAAPDDVEDVERVRTDVWEKLVEDEILDVQLDTLSPEEFVREVCRKIGRPPDPAWLPRGWDQDADSGGVNDNAGPPGGSADIVDSNPEAGSGWAEPPAESGDGCPPSRMPKPDSG
jgi:hypothetical protein